MLWTSPVLAEEFFHCAVYLRSPYVPILRTMLGHGVGGPDSVAARQFAAHSASAGVSSSLARPPVPDADDEDVSLPKATPAEPRAAAQAKAVAAAGQKA